jgi:hypothetical protein
MKKNSFVVICLRLLGIYFGVMGLSALPGFISAFSSNADAAASYFFISPIILVVSGLVLYICARQIGRHIIAFSEAEEDGLHITASEQSARLAMLILGIFIFVQTLPQLIQIAFDVVLYYKKVADVPGAVRANPHRWTYLIGPMLKLFISMVLILGPDKVMGFISKYDETFRKIESSQNSRRGDEQQ